MEPITSKLNRKKIAIIFFAAVFVLAVVFYFIYFVKDGGKKAEVKPKITPSAQKFLEPSGKTTAKSNKKIENLNKNISPGTEKLRLDPDHDDLSEFQEKMAGTDSNKYDTDDDGLNDYYEVMMYHTDPLNPDTDGDGASDGEEVKAGTDPLNKE